MGHHPIIRFLTMVTRSPCSLFHQEFFAQRLTILQISTGFHCLLMLRIRLIISQIGIINLGDIREIIIGEIMRTSRVAKSGQDRQGNGGG